MAVQPEASRNMLQLHSNRKDKAIQGKSPETTNLDRTATSDHGALPPANQSAQHSHKQQGPHCLKMAVERKVAILIEYAFMVHLGHTHTETVNKGEWLTVMLMVSN
eukprot:scaffold53234_cov21-Tisochrysis_lutea.AAC.2